MNATKKQKSEEQKQKQKKTCPVCNKEPLVWFSLTGRLKYCVRCLMVGATDMGCHPWAWNNWLDQVSDHCDPFTENPYEILVPMCETVCAVYQSSHKSTMSVYAGTSFSVSWKDLNAHSILATDLPTEPDEFSGNTGHGLEREVLRVIERICCDQRYFWFKLLFDISERNIHHCHLQYNDFFDLWTKNEYTCKTNAERVQKLNDFIVEMIESYGQSKHHVLKWIVKCLKYACLRGKMYFSDAKDFSEKFGLHLHFSDIVEHPFADHFPFIKSLPPLCKVKNKDRPYDSGLWDVWLDAHKIHRRLLLLCCARRCPECPLNADDLPLDMFKVIVGFAGLFFFPNITKGESFHKDGFSQK